MISLATRSLILNYRKFPLSQCILSFLMSVQIFSVENFKPKFNEMDGLIDRRSHTGIYKINNEGFPLNPSGRTGLSYRGMLGKWGPNHAADPIITRWKAE